MASIILYPMPSGSYSVLAAWPRPAVTPDAAWRPAAEITLAKRFTDETAARCYLAHYLPGVDPARVVIQAAEAP